MIRLVEFAALFTTFEEHVRLTSSVRQVVPPDGRWPGLGGEGETACRPASDRGGLPTSLLVVLAAADWVALLA